MTDLMTDGWDRLNIILPAEVKHNLVNDAHEKGLTLSSYVRMVLIDQTKKNKKNK